MEILEEDVEIAENQISFDFLKSGDTEKQTEKNSVWKKEDTLVVVMRADEKISPNFDICGKKMLDWVTLACSGCETKVIDEVAEENLLSALLPYAEKYAYVCVLFSDTPLLKRSTFIEIMDFFVSHDLRFLRLKKGYVFKREFLQSARMLLPTQEENFGDEDFEVVDDAQKLSYAFAVLEQRILDYHKSNGVVFFGENTIFVDADVEIESGAVIYPNNVIKGESYIGKNVILESGNYIFDTIVCDEAFVCQSYLEKSKVGAGSIVGPFKKLINQEI